MTLDDRPSTSRNAHEAALEPDLPIIDPHHHLWDLRPHLAHLSRGHALMEGLRDTPCYQLEDLARDASRGHDVRATVYMECGSSYRSEGPEALRPVGEVEFVNRLAEQGMARAELRACAGIVGHADLMLGDAVPHVLEAVIAAAPQRLKGVRHMAAYDPDPDVLGPTGHVPPGMLASEPFRAGFSHLERLGLSFDAWVLEPQLNDVTSLAHAFPRTTVVLDHTGTPLGIASYEGRLAERFPAWRSSMRELARCPNVVVKLGGLGNALSGAARGERVSSASLAATWKPYVLECVEAFGADRCMFESNYPVDGWVADYSTLWNAFKRITSGFSTSEKRALYAGSAARIYRLRDIDLTVRPSP